MIKKKTNKLLAKFSHYSYLLFIWGFFAVGILLSVGIVINFFTGYYVSFTAGTGSMKPYITGKCLILNKNYFVVGERSGMVERNETLWAQYRDEVIKNNTRVGDVVVWSIGNENIIHRVNSTCEGGFVTKGDANPNIDGCVPYLMLTSKLVMKFC